MQHRNPARGNPQRRVREHRDVRLWNVEFRMEKTTPSDSPLHRGRDGRKKASQCNNAACSPPVQGGVRGGSWKRPPRAAGI